MRITTIVVSTLIFFQTNAHQSLVHKPDATLTNSKIDAYHCPTRSSDSPCKVVCSAPGMELPFVKSNVDTLELNFYSDSFTMKGRTFEKQFATADSAIPFSGYFNNNVSCMVFGMDLAVQ